MTETAQVGMTVSLDGLRRSMARAYTKAVEGYRDGIHCGRDSDFDQLKEGLDELRMMIAAFM